MKRKDGLVFRDKIALDVMKILLERKSLIAKEFIAKEAYEMADLMIKYKYN